MSTVATPPAVNGSNVPVAQVPFDQRSVKFTPLAEADPIEISVGMVKNILAVRSRSGREPIAADVMKFLMLCKSRRLNPFVGDAYLLGYDSQDGSTNWSLITAIQALRKRAEANPQYDGCRCGVIVLVDGQPVEREGALLLDGDKCVGGWAVVERKDRKVATKAAVKLSVYDTGRSRWKKDPGGMITKVAEAAALRQAFPSDLAGLYIRDEFDRESEGSQTPISSATGVAGLKEKLHMADIPAPQAESDDVDQSAPDDDGNQEAERSASEMTPEELADLEREAKGGKLFNTSKQYE